MQKIRVALAVIAMTGTAASAEAAQYTATASVSEQTAPGNYNLIQKQLLAKRAAIVKAEKMASDDSGEKIIQAKIIDTHIDGDIYYVTIEV